MVKTQISDLSKQQSTVGEEEDDGENEPIKKSLPCNKKSSEKSISMRKTRSRDNKDLLKATKENQPEDTLKDSTLPKKRRRGKKSDVDKTASASGITSTPLQEPSNRQKGATNDKNLGCTKKPSRTVKRTIKSRKDTRSSKKHLSSSGFSMNNLLQKNKPSDSLQGDKILDIRNEFQITQQDIYLVEE